MLWLFVIFHRVSSFLLNPYKVLCVVVEVFTFFTFKLWYYVLYIILVFSVAIGYVLVGMLVQTKHFYMFFKTLLVKALEMLSTSYDR